MALRLSFRTTLVDKTTVTFLCLVLLINRKGVSRLAGSDHIVRKPGTNKKRKYCSWYSKEVWVNHPAIRTGRFG